MTIEPRTISIHKQTLERQQNGNVKAELLVAKCRLLKKSGLNYFKIFESLFWTSFKKDT